MFSILILWPWLCDVKIHQKSQNYTPNQVSLNVKKKGTDILKQQIKQPGRFGFQSLKNIRGVISYHVLAYHEPAARHSDKQLGKSSSCIPCRNLKLTLHISNKSMEMSPPTEFFFIYYLFQVLLMCNFCLWAHFTSFIAMCLAWF